MLTCGCFSPISQWLKIVFSRKEEDDNIGRIIEIGPPTNFRKEIVTIPCIDDGQAFFSLETCSDLTSPSQSTLHQNDSHGVIVEKEAAQNAAMVRQLSKRDQLRKQVLRLGAKLTT
ncbi:hypothetical protein TMatcc_002778 [Talaromyces marneffei ATCC 18224]|uniref:uncharacterized protein n=1 Tax=Talaromyces marneffei TaxID=37727 RepID=UPI0012AA14BC|nr:uncharacterized protein EYB26_002133 [Talaromyces marneffei]KAE8555523.1 hypothetical protein EYB25_000220 [Talaromyces marneffei]QGA14479.1 hypothetical protein EYB26_002133 [Talaromyces marneffei]